MDKCFFATQLFCPEAKNEIPLVKMGSLLLSRLGYLVSTETDSMEALELFRSRPENG